MYRDCASTEDNGTDNGIRDHQLRRCDMLWKIYGYDARGRYRYLCNMEADSFDEAIQKARSYFGYLNITGAQPL